MFGLEKLWKYKFQPFMSLDLGFHSLNFFEPCEVMDHKVIWIYGKFAIWTCQNGVQRAFFESGRVIESIGWAFGSKSLRARWRKWIKMTCHFSLHGKNDVLFFAQEGCFQPSQMTGCIHHISKWRVVWPSGQLAHLLINDMSFFNFGKWHVILRR